MEYNLQSDVLNVKASTIVRMSEVLTVITQEGPIDLTVDIISDFASIPPNYHEVFINVLTAKYYNKVSFGTNPFSECKLQAKRKWYEFWKIKWLPI